MEKALAARLGMSVVVGPVPDWARADNDSMKSGLVPDPDGAVRTGVY
jgi:hypothetical protein